MEDCELIINIPSEEEAAHLEPQSHVDVGLKLGPRSNHVHVYRVDVEEPLDSRTLSWNTRPSIGERITTLSVGYGYTDSYRFACPRDSLHSFMYVAASELSHIEWWQNKQTENPGMFSFQS